MADNIVIHCQYCGKRNIFYAPSPEQLSASPAKFKQLNSTAGAFDFGVSSVERYGTDPPPRSSRRGGLSSFWNSEAGVNVTTGVFAGSGSYLLTWMSGYDPVWSVVAGLTAGVGLPLLKVILYAPDKPKEDKSTKQKISIQIDDRSSDARQILRDDIQDDRITIEMLTKVAKAVVIDGRNFSKPQLAKKKPKVVSQNQYDWIKDEFERLRYAVVTDANQTVLTLRGKALLRKLAQN